MTSNDKKKFIINVLYITAIVGVLYFVFKYLLSWFMPFIIGFMIAYVLKPVTDFIENTTKIKNKGVSIFVISFFYVAIISMVGFVVVKIWDLIYEFIRQFPNIYDTSIQPMIVSTNEWLLSFVNTLSPDIADLLSNSFNEILSTLTQAVSSISKFVLANITYFAQKIPIYFITLLFSIICSVLITIDYENVFKFLKRQIPNEFQAFLFDAKIILVNTIFKMIKAYFILLFMAFIEMSIGFIILGIDHAIPIAALISILDIVPLIGIGGILVPWGIYAIIIGQRSMGIGLIVIYLVSYILRNALEPRVIGKQIGLPSLATIVAMFAGFKIFGFIGFMLAPIAAIMIKQLNDSKRINIYK